MIVDRMNYHHADWVYREHVLEYALTDEFYLQATRDLCPSSEGRRRHLHWIGSCGLGRRSKERSRPGTKR